MVRTRRGRPRSRTFVRDQRIAGALACLRRQTDTGRCRARRDVDLPRGIVRVAALRAGRIEACIFSWAVRRIRRVGTSCAPCSIQKIWPNATAVCCFPGAALREWSRPGRSSAPATASGLKPSAARSLKDRPQPSPRSGEHYAPAPIAARAFPNCRELSSGPARPAVAGIVRSFPRKRESESDCCLFGRWVPALAGTSGWVG